MSHTLDPVTFPLHGTRLIEASAGTGKTYTIAALYLRLVLGHGGENSFSRPLIPPEILVVTFTNAATEELRDRIRKRLIQAARFFRHNDTHCVFADNGDEADDFLQTLRSQYAQHTWAANARLLDRAAQWMDEAAIHTIHSWCQRMLCQHAFDSGSLFDLELGVNQESLLEDAACDYWRSNFYSRSVEEISDLKSMVTISTPQELLKKVKPLLNAGQSVSVNPFDLLKERRELIEAAKAIWQSDFDRAIELVQKAQADKNLNGNKYRLSSLNQWIAQITSWVRDSGDVPSEKAIKKFSGSGLKEGLSKNGDAPLHPAFDAFDTLLEQFAANPSLALSREGKAAKNFEFLLYSHAATEIQARVNKVKERLAVMGFDDMLTRLEDAIVKPGNQRLAKIIGNQYPVVMIDEFQDTDPVQYSIFSKIYLNKPDKGFFMIGDPKQAIYAFRGADIYTYLAARQDCDKYLYTLGKNFRSVSGMVDATNCFFTFPGSNPDSHPDGPFLFKDKIPFEPVSAQGRDDRFMVYNSELQAEGSCPFDDQDDAKTSNFVNFSTVAGIIVCHLDQTEPLKKTGKDGYLGIMAQAFADKIVHMLNLALQDPPRAGFVMDANSAIKPLRPSDIAVLVRNFHEADAIRQALSMRNIKSVYLSDGNSVFESKEASSLLYILRACAEPTNDAFLRAALASSVLDLPLDQLDELNHDETAWEKEVNRFKNYLSMWQLQGVLPMIRSLLFDFKVPSRLLLEPSGERQLTNLLHLSEILQTAGAQIDGEQALIRWFAKELNDQSTHSDNDDRILRLESDDELIRVVTIHKSKGLEYPLVFLPFICAFREVTSRNRIIRYHDEQGELKIVSNPDEADIAAADKERLAEDMRMLYVALTRSKYACWTGLGVMGKILKDGEKSELHRSAPGYLISGENPVLTPDFKKTLDAFKGECRHIRLEVLPAVNSSSAIRPEIYKHKECEKTLRLARKFNGHISRQWWITSYSGMVAGAKMLSDSGKLVADSYSPSIKKVLVEERSAPDSPVHDQLEEYASEVSASPQINPSERTIHTFPRGPEPGTFLHDLMEWASREGFCRIASDRHYLSAKINIVSARRGWSEWADFLVEWVQALLKTPLALLTQPGPDPATNFQSGLPELPQTRVAQPLQLQLPASPQNRFSDTPESATSKISSSIPDQLPEVCLPVSVNEITLSRITPDSCQAEMEFMFEAHKVETSVIDRMIQSAVLPGMARPNLQPNRLNGMLKGFIDLIFFYNGQYFIMDYKSNHLGQGVDSYSHKSMALSILEHRYDLQYVIYTLALHRLLKQRLKDRYDYDKDVGGIIYLFMRGVDIKAALDVNGEDIVDNLSGENKRVEDHGNIDKRGQGVYFDKPSFELIDLIDGVFSGNGDNHAL